MGKERLPEHTVTVQKHDWLRLPLKPPLRDSNALLHMQSGIQELAHTSEEQVHENTPSASGSFPVPRSFLTPYYSGQPRATTAQCQSRSSAGGAQTQSSTC